MNNLSNAYNILSTHDITKQRRESRIKSKTQKNVDKQNQISKIKVCTTIDMTLNTTETLHLIHPMKFQNLQKRSKISLGFCMCRNIDVRNIVQDINGKK